MLFQELESFLMLAECLNYSVAASKLYISQPSLSKTISTMEEELGFKLFLRSTRRVELTEEGRRFYLLSKAYLEQVRALNEGDRAISSIKGKLTIRMENILDTSFIPFILSAFHSRYPEVKLSTGTQKGYELIESIRAGKTDIGVISSFEVPEDGFLYKMLYPYQMSVLVSHDHPLGRRRIVPLKALKGETFVVLDASTSDSTQTILNLCAKAGLNLMDSIYAANFRQMFILTDQYEGVSFNVTQSDTWEYWGLRKVEVDLTDCFGPGTTAGMVLAWREDASSPMIDAFMQTVDSLKLSMPVASRLVDD